MIEDISRMGMDIAPVKEALSKESAGLESVKEDLFMEMAPKGSFSKGALNSLVKAHNKVSSLFGLPTYPSFEMDQTSFPSRFVKELSMIMKAVDDAIAEDVLDDSMALTLDNIKADRDLAALAGRLDLISRQKDFKKWLESAPKVEEVEEEMPEEVMSEEMSESDMDALMMGRM